LGGFSGNNIRNEQDNAVQRPKRALSDIIYSTWIRITANMLT